MGVVAADSSVFHAIADPTRRAILDVLRESDQTVMVMLARVRERFTGLTQPAFSQHLATLRRAGLVAAKKIGRMRRYSMRGERLAEVADWVVQFDKFWTEKFENLGNFLEKQKATRRTAGERDPIGIAGSMRIRRDER